MTKRKLALIIGAATGSLYGVPGTAHAAPGTLLTPSVFAVAAVGLANLKANCSDAGASGTMLAAIARPTFQSKSQALMSGQESALERITRQQQALSGALTSAASAAAYASPKDLGSGNCAGFARPFSTIAMVSPVMREPQASSEDFLASKRLPIQRTPLDGSWNRVRRGTVSVSYASALIGPTSGAAMTFEKLSSVNAWTNRHVRYVEDRVSSGKADHWSDARTTLRRRTGDCEDIAIAKMQLLGALGFDRSAMYFTIARDLVRNADHAVLIVRLDGRNWLLDNSTDSLLDANASLDYRPIMSFSQSKAWLHGYASTAARAR
jgi:predicted transglutaminase-like cysteine proteinase